MVPLVYYHWHRSRVSGYAPRRNTTRRREGTRAMVVVVRREHWRCSAPRTCASLHPVPLNWLFRSFAPTGLAIRLQVGLAAGTMDEIAGCIRRSEWPTWRGVCPDRIEYPWTEDANRVLPYESAALDDTATVVALLLRSPKTQAIVAIPLTYLEVFGLGKRWATVDRVTSHQLFYGTNHSHR
ncbi:hypothetical protein U1Q18_007827 [Sarracenia purpurea var. burkii]